MVRTSVPPVSLACAPKTCLTQERTVDLVRLLALPFALSGLPRLPSPPEQTNLRMLDDRAQAIATTF